MKLLSELFKDDETPLIEISASAVGEKDGVEFEIILKRYILADHQQCEDKKLLEALRLLYLKSGIIISVEPVYKIDYIARNAMDVIALGEVKYSEAKNLKDAMEKMYDYIISCIEKAQEITDNQNPKKKISRRKPLKANDDIVKTIQEVDFTKEYPSVEPTSPNTYEEKDDVMYQ